MIDAHFHLTHKGRTWEQTIAHIENIGAEKAVILPIEDGDDEFGWMTKDVVAAYEKYPDRIIPFCHVDVRRRDAVTVLEKWVETGVFKGYGEQKQHVRLNDPRLENVLAVCNDLAWPVTWHFQDGVDGYNQGLDHLETLLKKFPKVKFIGHAQTWWTHISADVPSADETLYPKGPVKSGGLIDHLLADYGNMFADLSAGSGLGGLTRDEDFAAGFLDRHSKKLMFATDCPCFDGKGAESTRGVCFAQLSLPFLERLVKDEDALADILHNNAVRILEL
ncbi:MAG: putative TIM-barrel fold metal-dependent hydrolase [Candidatus Latescibacterota bacterium]|jgi:predicted TIM-barrel fold metal-dependent hydrolase